MFGRNAVRAPKVLVVALASAGLLGWRVAKADELADLNARVEALQETIAQLKGAIAQLQGAQPPTAAVASKSVTQNGGLQPNSDAESNWPGAVVQPASGQRQLKIVYGPNIFELGGILNISYDHSDYVASTSEHGGANRIFGGNASRLNFTFTRALANGLSVQAFIDSSLVPSSGSGSVAGREDWLAFAGPIGRFRLGRIDTPVKSMGGYTDIFYATGIADDGQINMMGGEDVALGFTRRQQKSVRYDSPETSALKWAVQLALPNADGSATVDGPAQDERKGKVVSAALTYSTGPLSLGIGAEYHKSLRYTQTEGLSDWGARWGAKYVFPAGDIGIGGNVFNYEAENGTSVIRPFGNITANIYAGPGKIVLRYGHAFEVRGSAPDGTVICGKANAVANFTNCGGGLQLTKGARSGASQYTMGYDYPLDKQTALYGYYTTIRNGERANYNFGTNPYSELKPGQSLQGVSMGGIYMF
jgi:hypothetical protein